jgi:RNA polymerase sigma-70 factor, ECF subfamily
MASEIASRDVVLARVRARVVGFVASRVSRDVAEDVAQETLMLLTTKYPHVADPVELVPLSLRIARLKLMNHWRKSRRAPVVSIDRPDGPPEPPSADEDNESAVVRRQLLDQLLRAIDTLGERCRRLLWLRLEGRDFEEIRVQMEAASINTVYTWDNRCRKSLRDALGSWWTGPLGQVAQ